MDAARPQNVVLATLKASAGAHKGDDRHLAGTARPLVSTGGTSAAPESGATNLWASPMCGTTWKFALGSSSVSSLQPATIKPAIKLTCTRLDLLDIVNTSCSEWLGFEVGFRLSIARHTANGKENTGQQVSRARQRSRIFL